ncbi:polycystin-1-like protein 2 [Palaemon carinicauda]|uniref:polycystin-1-like protein 2 n=1 Tax=Palaemon carinicauda TaxID=392227 RepID=UPI0035B57CB8
MDEVNMNGWDCRNKSILSIPPRTLNYGTYRFTYSVVIEDEWLKIHEPDLPPFRREKSTYIKVTKSPLVVLMNSGGVAKVVLGFNKTLLINPAEFSYDPDWLDAKDFDFKWYCYRISPTAEILPRNSSDGNWPTDGVVSKPLTSVDDVTTYVFNSTTNTTEAIEDPDNGGCFGEGPGRILIEGGTVELNTMQLRKTNVTYRFVVVLSKDTRKAEGSIDVKLVPGSPPAVDVKCQIEKMCRFTSDGMYINPNSRLALMGACQEDCYGYLSYFWSIYTFVNNTETLIPDGNIYMVNPDQPNMVIRNELFMTYKDVLEFHVKLTIVRHVDKEKGQGFMYLLINTPPGKGKCTLSPPKGRLLTNNPAELDPVTGEPKDLGRALTEDFYCACLNFTDDQNDKITKYTFFLKHTTFGYIKNLKFGVDFKDRFVFPYGNWSMWVTITDEYGAASTIFIANFSTSLPTRSEFLAWESKSELLRASGEGDQARLSQLLLASTSISGFQLEDDVIASTTTTPSSFGGLPPATTTMDPLVKKELEEKARLELEAKQMKAAEEKQYMISQLQSNNVDTLDDCAQLLSTIASIIGTGDLVDLKGKDSAISVISGTCTAKVLLNTTINDPKDAESLISNNMQAISSLVTGTSDKVIDDDVLPSDIVSTEKGDYGDYEMSAVEEVDDGSLTPSEVERLRLKKLAVKVQKEKAVLQVKDMLDTVERMQKKLLSIVFPGEDPVTVDTEDGLSMTLVMMKAEELLGYQLWQGGGLYEFPDICDILKEEKEAPGNCSSTEAGNFTVGIQAIAWPTILQSFGAGAKEKLDRTTKTMQLNLLQRISAVDVKVIPVEDLDPESEIIIYIPRGSRKKSRTQVFDPQVVYPNEVMAQSIPEDGPLVCTTLNITQPDSSVNIELVLERSEANVIVFVRKYFKATLVFYDMVINPKTEARVTNVSQPLFDTMDPLTNLTIAEEYSQYEIFLTNDFTRNDTGEYYICVGEFANETDDETFWKEPEMYNLTATNMTRQWSTNFTVRSYTSSCLFYNGETQSWDSDGCRVLNANYTHTICSCNHLTSFGSGFFPQPNTIDFNKLLNMNAADNPTIIITMIASLCIYIMVLIWGRYKDKEDLTKLGATPLPDNDPRDKYLYEIMVFTGGNEEAATKSKVQFTLSGDEAESSVRTFDDPSRPIFKRNAIDIFVMAVPGALGSLQYLRVWHDNSGKGKMASWYLRYIIIRDVQTGQKYEFICNRWFAVEHDDSKIDRLLPVAGDVQKKEFKHLFQTTSHKNLYDGHLWFSVFARPARSRFTRVQRITACMALLYLSMVTNAMFFGVIPEEPGSGGLALGPFSVSPAAIGVGMISNLITFPPTLIIIQLFRKASPKFKRVSRIQKAMEKQKEAKRKEAERKNLLKQTATLDVSRVAEDAEVPKIGQPEQLAEPAVKRKKQKSFPWWTLYIAWIVAILSIGAGAFFTFAYGVTFGEELTKKWLGALLVSFFSSVLFTQPIKVILMAVIFSAVFKKPVEDEDDADFDEREPVLGEDEEWMHQLGPGTREKKKVFKPADDKFIKSAKIERQKEIKMWDVIYDIGAYAFFIWIVLVLSHGNRDPNSFLMKMDLDKRFILASLEENVGSNLYTVQNQSLFYHWMKTVVVNEIIMQENYNNKFNDINDNRLLLNDRVSLLLGYTTLRQIRIKNRTCRLPKIIKTYITKDCRSKSSVIDEEDEDFGVGWKPLADGVKAKEEYTHKGSLELDGMPFWGKIDVYSGSGYQVKLIGGKDAVIQKLNELEANHWIDRRTRAVFVEFSIYNAQVNLFAAIRVCLEQGPEGALHPYVKINTMKLLRYHEGFGLFVMICEGLFIAFIVYYTYRELKDMCRDKRKYWKDSWNYLEIIVIVLGWSAIVFYGIRTALGVYLMNKFKTNKTGYIKLDYAAHIDEVFLYIISFLVFFATLKFIKLLRFNKRIGMLSSTLKQCAADLSGFMLAFLLSFLSAAQLFYLLHYSSTLNFSTFMSSLESTFSAMLGKIEYDEIAQSSPGLGPITFFMFAFFTGIIMVNLLLTLVLRSFYDIKQDIKRQGNEYEILDFIMTKIKKAAGIAPKSTTVKPMNATEEDKKQEDDKTEEFPEKVDQLLTYINQFYFDSKLDFNNKEWVKTMSMQNRDQSALGPHSGKARTSQGWHGATNSDNLVSTFKNVPKTASQKTNSIAELSDL